MKPMHLIDSRWGDGQIVETRLATYANGGRALQLYCPDGEPWATVSVKTSIDVPPDAIAVKTWSENEGLLALLLDAEILVGPLLFEIPCGYAAATVYALNPQLLEKNDG